ncbi:MAG: cytochrome c-type biogenesis protein [Burkholderiaceae bacterium]
MTRFVSILVIAVLLGIAAAMPAGDAAAQTASGQPYLAPGITDSLITDPADKARYDRLAHELRCLVCQNQTLAESDASLAADLRRQVETMVIDGRSDDQIKRFLVERYGDFVLYRPPMQSNTWLLWFGPFVLLAVGIGVWMAINRRRSRSTASPAPDLERVRKLLDEG